MRKSGSYGEDVDTFWKIITVIALHLPHTYLSSQAELDRIAPSHIPRINNKDLGEYVKRIQKLAQILLPARTFAQLTALSLVYHFVFEDIIFWTEEEAFHFLRKYSYLVFNVMTFTERTELFRYLGIAGPLQINTNLFKSVPKKIKDRRLRAVFMYKNGNYHEHGKILKFPRNAVAHVNDAAQKFNMPKIRREIEIHSLALKQVDAAIPHINYLSDGLLRYALTGVFKFMDNNFVGLSVSNGYIATGSETNEVFVYHKAFPMPALSFKFAVSGNEVDDSAQFISSVCWRGLSSTLVAANSTGNIKILEMV